MKNRDSQGENLKLVVGIKLYGRKKIKKNTRITNYAVQIKLL
jgi:hypothetical protein